MGISNDKKITCLTKKVCPFKKGSTKEGCKGCSQNKKNKGIEGLEDKSKVFIRDGYF
jgi:hypothetical protein